MHYIGKGDLKSVSVGKVIKLTTLQGARTFIRKFLVKSCLIVTLDFILINLIFIYTVFTSHCLKTGFLIINFQNFADVFIHPVTCVSFAIYLWNKSKFIFVEIRYSRGVQKICLITSISSTSGSSSVSGSGYRAWVTRSAWSWMVPASMSGLMNTIASENRSEMKIEKEEKAIYKTKTQSKPLTTCSLHACQKQACLHSFMFVNMNMNTVPELLTFLVTAFQWDTASTIWVIANHQSFHHNSNKFRSVSTKTSLVS